MKAVRNLLQVVPSKQEEGVNSADSAIEDNVKTALKGDSLLGRSAIRVQSVNNGTVLLAGKAESLTAELRHRNGARGSWSLRGTQRDREPRRQGGCRDMARVEQGERTLV